MGFWFRKKSVREAIIEIEQQIKEKEKEIKYLKKNKEAASDLFIKTIAAVVIGALSVLWICKESFSYLYLSKIGFVFILAGGIITVLYYGSKKMCNYRLTRKMLKLEELRETQRENIESLKKETKYEETHGIIKRYAKSSSVEEEEKKQAKENIVDRIAKLI